MEELINKLKATELYKNEDNILILVYGSRVLGTNRSDSDLDVLVFHNGKNYYKTSFMLDNVQVEACLFPMDVVWDLIPYYNKKNNYFFKSIFNECIVIKDKEYLFNYLSDLVNEKDESCNVKDNLSDILNDISNHYYNLFNNKEYYWLEYYVLLNKIRIYYLKKHNLSYMATFKSYNILNKEKKYDSYLMKLPKDNFINCYMEALNINDIDKSREFIKIMLYKFVFVGCKIIPKCNIEPLSHRVEIYNDDIKYKLIQIKQKYDKLVLKYNNKSKDYLFCYYNLLSDILEFNKFYGIEDNEFYKILDNLLKRKIEYYNIELLINYLNQYYKIDFNNYNLKLTLDIK